jgi:hypothetical protein
MAQPLPGDDDDDDAFEESAPPAKPGTRTTTPRRPRPARISSTPQGESGNLPRTQITNKKVGKLDGRVLGSFRNTYYDFPSEADYEGESVQLKNAACKTIKDVARGFYEAVCVQGSGTLLSGATVSFAKRDCECAPICPRTQQRICFDSLDAAQFPWGRGAIGKPIMPLLTIAVDSNVIPMGAAVYIPEYDGVPRDPSGQGQHDGCFIAQDRGVRVQGKHVDIFTGHRSVTELWNRLVPSNKGVTVVLESPRCARAETGSPGR